MTIRKTRGNPFIASHTKADQAKWDGPLRVCGVRKNLHSCTETNGPRDGGAPNGCKKFREKTS